MLSICWLPKPKMEFADIDVVTEDHFYNLLQAVVDETQLLTRDKIQLLDPGVDSANLSANLAVLPTSTEQVSDILKVCNKHNISVVPQGGRTGLCGGANSRGDQLILMTDRLNKLESVDAAGGVAVVEAGVRLEPLNEQLGKDGWSVGIDLGARGSATIGGMVSTNAGGNEAFRNGVMRQRVLGVEAVMADGSIFSDLGKVTKNNDGYDIKQLLIGSEGTLGVVTKVALKLALTNDQPTTALCSCDSAKSAVALFNRFRRDKRFHLLAAECMWRDHARTVAEELSMNSLVDFFQDEMCVLLEIEKPAAEFSSDVFEQQLFAAAENGEISDALIAKNDGEREQFWRVREDWAAEKKYPHGLWYDVSVPHSVLDEYVRELHERMYAINPHFRIFIIGHLGDGNLHLSITTGEPHSDETRSLVTAEVFRGLKEKGGAISAEHGIGIEKFGTLPNYCCPTKYALMKLIKGSFDPNNILNPGKYVSAS